MGDLFVKLLAYFLLWYVIKKNHLKAATVLAKRTWQVKWEAKFHICYLVVF